MLDECKGDKCEEVLRVFAITVLRKEARRRFGNASGLLAGNTETLTAAELLTVEQRERLLPLILAHSQTLRRQLSQRKRTEKSFGDQEQRLDEARASLAERRKAVVARESHLPAVAPEEIAAIADRVKTVWTGNESWAEALLHGRPEHMDPRLNDQHLHSGMQSISDTTGLGSPRPSAQFLLADLNHRIEKQQLRLEKWTMFRASLEKTQKSRRTDNTVRIEQSILKFDAHQKLQPSAEWCDGESSTLRTEQDPGEGMELIEAMRFELANLKKSRTLTTESHDEVGGSIHGSRDMASSGRKRNTPPKGKRTALEPLYGSGAEDVADTYSATVVESNVEKHEFPEDSMKSSHPSSETGADGNSPNPSLDASSRFTTKRPSDDDGLHPSSETCLGSSSYQNPTLNPTRPVSEYDFLTRDQEHFLPRCSTKLPSTPPLHPAGHMPAEKTEISPDSPDSTPTRPTPDITGTPSLQPPPSQRISTLLERTRQSMALLPTPSESIQTNQRLHLATKKSSKDKQPKHQNHHSFQISAVNPFQAQHSQQQPQPQQRQQRSITPRDQLFSDQADYASVFRSRPRVAVSPPIGTSPERGIVGLDGDNDEEGEEEEEEEEEEGEEDSVGPGGRGGGAGSVLFGSSPVSGRPGYGNTKGNANGSGNGNGNKNVGWE